MADLLISGPAGAGKTQQARGVIDDGGAPVVAADFQSLLAALLLLERGPDGRYPERQRMQAYALPMAEYLRQTIITLGARNGVDVIVTNSDGQGARRKTLLDALRPGAVELVNDPGMGVVRGRLAVDGVVSGQCEDAIARWYGRL